MSPPSMAVSNPDEPVIASGTPLGPEVVAGLAADVGFAVWQVLRAVRLWTAQREEAREGLFDAGHMEAWERELLTGSLEPELRHPLAVVVGELAASPAALGRLSWACVCVADWALGRGAVAAGLAFAEAAAMASPTQSRYAWLAGRLMRTHGEGRGAERWLRRAHRVAVAEQDGETQARALTALGNLALQRGNYPAAREFQMRALRVSRRWRLREQEGMALHDLFAISIHDGHRAEADRFARAAVAAYRESPRLPRLVHDIAYHWLQQGYASRALNLFRAVRPYFATPELQVRIVANLARASAAVGDRNGFERYKTELRDLESVLQTRETLASALLQLAYGAVAMEDWTAANALAMEATEAAEHHGEKNVVVLADELMTAIGRRVVSHPHAMPEERRTTIAAVDEFAAEMVMLLTESGASV